MGSSIWMVMYYIRKQMVQPLRNRSLMITRFDIKSDFVPSLRRSWSFDCHLTDSPLLLWNVPPVCFIPSCCLPEAATNPRIMIPGRSNRGRHNVDSHKNTFTQRLYPSLSFPSDKDILEGIDVRPLSTFGKPPQDITGQRIEIKNQEYIGSYNWIPAPDGCPTIVVPGKSSRMGWVQRSMSDQGYLCVV